MWRLRLDQGERVYVAEAVACEPGTELHAVCARRADFPPASHPLSATDGSACEPEVGSRDSPATHGHCAAGAGDPPHEGHNARARRSHGFAGRRRPPDAPPLPSCKGRRAVVAELLSDLALNRRRPPRASTRYARSDRQYEGSESNRHPHVDLAKRNLRL